MYRVQYYCPRQAPIWQDLTEGLIFQTPRLFRDFPSARSACDSLVWMYHAARVLDPSGRPVYQI